MKAVSQNITSAGLTYPMEAQIDVSDSHRLVLKVKIPAAALTGLYPVTFG
jgi:hypothetical protein